MNHAGHDPAKVCDTVFAAREFSWTDRLVHAPTPVLRRARAEHFMPNYPVAWKRTKRIAYKVIAGTGKDVIGVAPHYHATFLSPRRPSSFVQVAQIGNHVFFGDRRTRCHDLTEGD